MTHGVDHSHQNFIIARLADFCRWGRVSLYENDSWDYMKEKLLSLEEPLSLLKQQQLRSAANAFISKLQQNRLRSKDIAEFKSLVDSYLTVDDYADASFNLTPRALENPGQRPIAVSIFKNLKADCLFQRERDPNSKANPKSEILISELYHRLELDQLESLISRRPITLRRKRMFLRRIRKNVNEYCAVLHLPTHSNDTFSPFMLLRVEALLIACLRILKKF